MKARPLNKRTGIKYFICDVYEEVYRKENGKLYRYNEFGGWVDTYNRCSCSRNASEKEAKEKFPRAFIKEKKL